MAAHWQTASRGSGYKLTVLSGMKTTWILLPSGNENRAKFMLNCKLFYWADPDLCTKALCCAAAEIFNTIYR